MVSMKTMNGAVSDDAILRFEGINGLRLPSDYRQWLSDTGGGQLLDSAIEVSNQAEPLVDMEIMFSIEEITQDMNVFGLRLPARWVPIGASMLGDRTLTDTKNGAIIHLLTTDFLGVGKIELHHGMRIGNSFSEVIEKLQSRELLMKKYKMI